MDRKLINIGLFLLLLFIFSGDAAAQGSGVKRVTMYRIIAVADSIVNTRMAIYRTARLRSEIRMINYERFRYAGVKAFMAGQEPVALSFRQARGNAGVNGIRPLFEMPKMEFAFSNALSWTTYFQYDGFLKNYNVNSRLQWRIKPLSDIYLAYSDNYFAYGTQHNERNHELKIGFWMK